MIRFHRIICAGQPSKPAAQAKEPPASEPQKSTPAPSKPAAAVQQPKPAVAPGTGKLKDYDLAIRFDITVLQSIPAAAPSSFFPPFFRKAAENTNAKHKTYRSEVTENKHKDRERDRGVVLLVLISPYSHPIVGNT